MQEPKKDRVLTVMQAQRYTREHAHQFPLSIPRPEKGVSWQSIYAALASNEKIKQHPDNRLLMFESGLVAWLEKRERDAAAQAKKAAARPAKKSRPPKKTR